MLEKYLSALKTFKRLWPRLAPFKTYLFVMIICLVINGASDTFLLLLIQLLLDDGSIVEQGNYKEFINQNGVYAQLHPIQFNE